MTVLYVVVLVWAVTLLGVCGDRARMLGWYLGPLAATGVLVFLSRWRVSSMQRILAVIGVGVLAALGSVAAIENPWNLTVVNDIASFFVTLVVGAVLLVELLLVRLSLASRVLKAALAVLAIASTVGVAFFTVVLGLFLYVGEAPGWPSDEHVSPSASLTVEVRPTFDVHDNAIYVRTGWGPLERERRVASAGTYTAIGSVRFVDVSTIAMERWPVDICGRRTVTIDPTTLTVIADSHVSRSSIDEPTSSFC